MKPTIAYRPHSLVLSIVAVVASGCGSSAEIDKASSSKPVVYVDSYPLAYFAERLAVEDATIEFPTPADVDPAHWKPDDETVRKYQEADLVLTSGPHYATWLTRVSLPPKNVVDTTAAIPDDSLIQTEGAVVHSHGDEGEHSHAAYAIHTWLDPKLALLQADAVRAALVERLPDRSEAIDRRFAELRTDLSELEARLDAVKTATTGKTIIASHPVYDYLGRAAGWDLRSLHWEPNVMPDEEGWWKFGVIAEPNDVRWMLWDDTPIEPIQQALADRKVEWIVIRHCGNRPAEGDFLTAMRANYDALDTLATGTDDDR